MQSNLGEKTRPIGLSQFDALKRELWTITTWSVLIPVLILWPFLSAFPAFSLIEAPGSPLRITILLALVASGFWSLLALAIVWNWVRLKPPADTAVVRRPWLRAALATYGSVWIAAYLAITYLKII